MPDAPGPDERSATRRPIERLFDVYATSVDARDGNVLRRLKAALSEPAPTTERTVDRSQADHRTP
jgi:hypothetical protein